MEIKDIHRLLIPQLKSGEFWSKIVSDLKVILSHISVLKECNIVRKIDKIKTSHLRACPPIAHTKKLIQKIKSCLTHEKSIIIRELTWELKVSKSSVQWISYFPAYYPQALLLVLWKKFRRIICTGNLFVNKNVMGTNLTFFYPINRRMSLIEKKLFNLILRLYRCGLKETGISKRN